MSATEFKASESDGFIAKPFVPFLKSEMEFTIWPQPDPNQPDSKLDKPTQRQLDIANRVLAWPEEMWTIIDDAAERYRAEVDGMVDLADYDLGHINRANIRKHYQIYGIAIPSFEEIDDTHDYVWIMAGCDWEDEHGMECILINQKAIYCGGTDCLYMQPHFREWTHIKWP